MNISEQTCVLVTGGSSGIGLAVTRACLARGARVAVNALPGDERAARTIADLRASHGDAILPAIGDVSDQDQATRMVQDAAAAFGGRLSVLVNNAGTSNTVDPIPMAALDRMTAEFWDTIMATNLLGPFWCSRAAAPFLEDGGAIVNTASLAGLGGDASSMAYAASKAALINLTANLARALAPGVRVNAVAPGLTRTPWTADWPQDRIERSLGTTLLNRWVEAEDVAHAILFLAENPSMTAQTVVVDAGRGKKSN